MYSRKILKSMLLIILISSTHSWFGFGSSSEEEPTKDEKVETKEEESIEIEIEKSADSNSRVHEQKLSDQGHFVDNDHDGKFEHNSEYDHEAFLGKEDAEEFKSLTPDESKDKLSKILNKVDRNRDKFINENELRNWIRSQHKNFIQKSSNKKWTKVNSNKDGLLTFEELLENTIGEPETWSEAEKEANKEDYKTYVKMLERDKKKFKAADQDKDGKLNKKEYADFLHPEDSPAMRDIVINETLEDLDANKDGVVDIEEFISDFYEKGSAAEEPDWVKIERSNFIKIRDLNNDKVLDREELANWILPNDFDRSLSEAQHLIYEADENKDGKLTKEEVMNKYSVFVSSTATNYGSDLYEHEDL